MKKRIKTLDEFINENKLKDPESGDIIVHIESGDEYKIRTLDKKQITIKNIDTDKTKKITWDEFKTAYDLVPLSEVNESLEFNQIKKEFGSPPQGTDLRERGGQLYVYFYSPDKKANDWANKIRKKYPKDLVFIDTSKIKESELNESKKDDKLVKNFKNYIESVGYTPINVWSNEFGLFAHIKEYLKSTDNFTQIYSSDSKIGTIVRLSYKDIDNERIVGDFVFENIDYNFTIDDMFKKIKKTNFKLISITNIKKKSNKIELTISESSSKTFYTCIIYKDNEGFVIEDLHTKRKGYIDENEIEESIFQFKLRNLL